MANGNSQLSVISPVCSAVQSNLELEIENLRPTKKRKAMPDVGPWFVQTAQGGVRVKDGWI